MSRIGLSCLLLVLLPAAAGAEEASRRFPIEQRFVATSLNGEDFGIRTLTLTISRDARGGGFRGAGFAGCNTWNGRITIGDGDRFVVDQLATTRKFCSTGRMAIEQDFLAALKSMTHWRMDGPTLILAGDRSTLLLAPVTRRARI